MNYGSQKFYRIKKLSLKPLISFLLRDMIRVGILDKDFEEFPVLFKWEHFCAFVSTALFWRESSPALRIVVDPSERSQTILGFGGAFSDSVGITLNSLSVSVRERLLNAYFHPEKGPIALKFQIFPIFRHSLHFRPGAHSQYGLFHERIFIFGHRGRFWTAIICTRCWGFWSESFL